MIYGSICSGIEAATVAWHPLGWRPAFFSEIEAFPRAVLRHHYPEVPLHGDFTTIEGGEYGAIDLLVGGTPCQDFSVAGLRAGLAGERGNLTLEFVRLARRLRPAWIVWENVPGILSDDSGRSFGAFLGALAILRYGFAYRVLDAQYAGLAQRRERVFVVGYLGDWRRAAAVLFERHSLSGNPPPRREEGEGIAPTISARPTGGGGLGTDFDCDDGLIANCLNAKGGAGRMDGESETFIAHCVRPPSHGAAWRGDGADNLITHSLRADGFDASEDGTGRGTPLIPIQSVQAVRDKKQNGIGIGADGDEMFTLTGRDRHAVAFQHKASASQSMNPGPVSPTLEVGKSDGVCVAFSCKDHGADAGDLAPTLRAMGHDGSHANAGGQLAVMTLAIRGRGESHDLEYRTDGTSNAILTPNGGRAGIGVGPIAFGGQMSMPHWQHDLCDTLQAKNPKALTQGMAVRRLTPRECERLQGFPDDYTAVPYRGKPAADGPRYKALGNSFAVPVVRWIGERIEMVERLIAEAA